MAEAASGEGSWPWTSVDIGANLTDPMFQGSYFGREGVHGADLDEVLGRAGSHGVHKVVVTGGSLADAREGIALCEVENGRRREGVPRLFATVGVHPTRCGEFEHETEEVAEGDTGAEPAEWSSTGFVRRTPRDGEAYLAALEALVQENKGVVVAVGECGLDYDRETFCTRDVQLKWFVRHFALAEKVGLPLFLHNRNTGGDFVRVLREHAASFVSTGCVVHSFTGSAAELEDLLAVAPNVYIGLNGCSLKTDENLHVARQVPLERLMVETDAPWCEIKGSHASKALVRTQFKAVDKKKKARGDGHLVKGRCEPAQVVQVVEAIAELKGIDPSIVADRARRNAEALFRI